MRHELVRLENGASTLRDPRTGETMHSYIGPEEEAERIYVDQSDLPKRLEDGSAPPLVVYDLGLGVGANALATLRRAETLAAPRKLRIVSFENDPEGLAQALERVEQFPFLRGFETAAAELLACDRAERPGWSWELRRGSYPETLEGALAPDVVFHDFYSPKTLPAPWEVECLLKLRARCERAVVLTYCSATRFRASLFAAGFFVGEGVSTAAKRETTIAATHLEDLARPLPSSWRGKIERSSTVSAELRTRALESPQLRG